MDSGTARKASISGGAGRGQRRQWADMVPDLLAAVFSRLDMDGLLAVQLVCKAWHGAALSPHCWDSLHLELHDRFLDAFVKEEAGVEDALCRCDRKRMNLRAWCIVRRSAERAKSVCLESVTSEESVRDIVQRCPFIESLALHDCRGLPESILTDLVSSSSRLRLLSLRGCDGAATASFIRELGRNCLDLIGLNLGSVSISDHVAAAIPGSLPNLRYLNLSHTDITEAGALGILTSCAALEYLDLRSCPSLDAYQVGVLAAKVSGGSVGRQVRCGVSVVEAVERDWGWGYGSWYP